MSETDRGQAGNKIHGSITNSGFGMFGTNVAGNVIFNQASVPRSEKISVLSTLRYPRDTKFVGRLDILTTLDTILEPTDGHRRAALYGLGGIGKSQIAIEYAYRLKERVPNLSIFWMHASTRARFQQSLLDIASKAKIPGLDAPKADSQSLVYEWLVHGVRGPWLMVLDSADDSSVFFEPENKQDEDSPNAVGRLLIEFVPQANNGIVIITSSDRNTAFQLCGDYSEPVAVGSMTEAEALELLRNKKLVNSSTEADAVKLLKNLEFHPLAISQASAYIKQNSPLMSISKYLAEFLKSYENKATLLNINAADLRRDPRVSNAVITSWQMSINQIRRDSPRAADMLSLMACHSRYDIPKFLIQGDADDDGCAFISAVTPLISFSLITADSDVEIFNMHPLVEIATKTWLKHEQAVEFWEFENYIRTMKVLPFDGHVMEGFLLSVAAFQEDVLPGGCSLSSLSDEKRARIDRFKLQSLREIASRHLALRCGKITDWETLSQDWETQNLALIQEVLTSSEPDSTLIAKLTRLHTTAGACLSLLHSLY